MGLGSLEETPAPAFLSCCLTHPFFWQVYNFWLSHLHTAKVNIDDTVTSIPCSRHLFSMPRFLVWTPFSSLLMTTPGHIRHKRSCLKLVPFICCAPTWGCSQFWYRVFCYTFWPPFCRQHLFQLLFSLFLSHENLYLKELLSSIF